jgi:hypothetical protein
MPWTLAVVLTILLPLAAINFYVGRKILQALSALTSWNRIRLRMIIIGVYVYLDLLPLVYLLAYLAAGRAAVPAFSGDNYLIDLFLSYPFWIALVVMIQLSLPASQEFSWDRRQAWRSNLTADSFTSISSP